MHQTVTKQTDTAIDFSVHQPFKEKFENNFFQELSLLKISYVDNIRSIYGNLKSPLEEGYNLRIKRIFDIIFSLFILIALLSWLIPIMIILIKLDSKGPVFFFQKRKKKNGALFTCIKLRTMMVNNEADTLAASESDNRITRIGNILRHYHLDELPQIVNVLKGDMSIIGPRPYMIIEDLKYENEIKEYIHRYEVKPGITGLAQSIGHFGFTNDLQKIDERVMIDLLYIKRWSFKMDIQILYRTFCSVFIS